MQQQRKVGSLWMLPAGHTALVNTFLIAIALSKPTKPYQSVPNITA